MASEMPLRPWMASETAAAETPARSAMSLFVTFPIKSSFCAHTARVNISIGVVDKGLGSGCGININSTEEEINATAKHIRAVIAGL